MNSAETAGGEALFNSAFPNLFMWQIQCNIGNDNDVVELKAWKSMHASITSPMITAWGAKDIPASRLAIGFAYIERPERLGGDTHSHEQDQWIFLIGGNSKNLLDFDADCEMFLGDKVRKVNYPCYFYIPQKHAPLPVGR
jgi:hypothetical protein